MTWRDDVDAFTALIDRVLADWAAAKETATRTLKEES